MKLINGLSIALAVFTVILTIVFFGWWIMKDSVVFGSEKFDQVKWMQSAATITSECKRGDMAYDLQKNILARGSSKDAVGCAARSPKLRRWQGSGIRPRQMYACLSWIAYFSLMKTTV